MMAFCVVIMPVFFQAEDGIRSLTVTGVQTCALPISSAPGATGLRRRSDRQDRRRSPVAPGAEDGRGRPSHRRQIGTASCRESPWELVGFVPAKKYPLMKCGIHAAIVHPLHQHAHLEV